MIIYNGVPSTTCTYFYEYCDSHYPLPQPRRSREEQRLYELMQAFGDKVGKFLYREEQNRKAAADARSRARRPPPHTTTPRATRMQTATAALAARGLSRRWV